MKKNLFALILALSLSLALTACGGGTAQGGPAPNTPEESAPQKEVDLTEFYNALLSENEWPELMALEGEALGSFYPGLSDLGLKQCLVNTAAISAAVGEIALAEAETEEDAKTVQEIFQARIDYQVGDEDNPGGAWYPETIEGWKNKSQIVRNGNYIMLAVGDAAEAAVERFNALFA